MHSYSSGLQENSLLVTHLWGDTEELLFVQQHLFAPSPAEGIWSGEITVFAKIVVAGSA
jgi:hypothetical protein